MEEVKRYEDMLLSPYVDDVEDQPLRPGHEQYLTYMPKDGELMRGMTDTRRVRRGRHDGVTIEQTFSGDDCAVTMRIDTHYQPVGSEWIDDIDYVIDVAPQGNRQFGITIDHTEKIFIDTTLDAELQEIPAELQLRELDNVLGKIQDLDQSHVVRLAEEDNLELFDFRQLTLLSEAAKRHSYDENLREVQILSNTASANRVYQKVAVVRRGQDDTYLTIQLANEKMLRIYAEGIPSRGALDHSHYDIKEKLDTLNERMQRLTDHITPQSMMTAMSVDRQRKRLEALEIVRQDARKLTYSETIDLDDPSLEEYPFEDILNHAVQNAISNVSSEYRVDMEIKRQEEQDKLDISDLSDEDVQNLEF